MIYGPAAPRPVDLVPDKAGPSLTSFDAAVEADRADERTPLQGPGENVPALGDYFGEWEPDVFDPQPGDDR